MMKKIMALAIAGCMLIASCGKNDSTTNCTPATPASEEPQIVAYSTAQGFTTTKDPSGVYYEVLNAGTGVRPTANSTVTVQYTGKLFNGTVFDSNTSAAGVQFPLYNLIQGWQIGIPLIRVGGKIRLIVPSAYAYGCTGAGGSIPPNTPLFFEISLLAVN